MLNQQYIKTQSPGVVNAAADKIWGKISRGEHVSFKEFDESGMSIKEYIEDLFESWHLSSNDESGDISFEELREFDRKDTCDSVLGDRFLCNRGSLVFNGASGIGKSSLIMQAAICWALGRDFFGIKPNESYESLRILFIQSENNVGDMAEAFQDITRSMKLEEGDFGTLERNLVFKHQTTLTGTAFVKYAADQIKKSVFVEKDYVSKISGRKFDRTHGIDLVIADPLLCYIGGDVTRQEVVSKFLRNELQPLLDASDVVWIWIHHTNKPRDGRGGRTGDERMYFGNGSSEITNWARAIMTLERKGGDKFLLSIDKREKRSPWRDNDGNRVKEIAIQHSKDGIVWERATGGAIVSFDSALASDLEQKAVRDFIAEKGTVSLSLLQASAPTLNGAGIGVHRATTIARALVEDGSEPRIWAYKEHTKGSTNKSQVFSMQPPPAQPVIKQRRNKKRESVQRCTNSDTKIAV